MTETTRSEVSAGVRWSSAWMPGRGQVDSAEPGAIRWFDLVSDVEATDDLLLELSSSCPGLTRAMLTDLLTPDEEPEGRDYKNGIKLASTFSVEAKQPAKKRQRGSVRPSGVLVFQPVELLSGKGWLLTCFHATRTFAGAEKAAEGEPAHVSGFIDGIARDWLDTKCESAGDLGVLLMNQLAIGYKKAHWQLAAWHENWELSLYVDDELDNPAELPLLWGSMAVLRDWLNPLNYPGLRKDMSRAWLTVTNHENVKAVDDRIDSTLAHLKELANTMRLSFSVLNVQLAEEERRRKEDRQRQIESFAVVFLVPTFVVGLYGANTWVPGENQHWGFWVMVTCLILFSGGVLAALRRLHNSERDEARRRSAEKERLRSELVKGIE